MLTGTAAWRITAVGFLVYSLADAYVLFRLFDYCESNTPSNRTLFSLALLSWLLYMAAMPTFLILGKNRWTRWATIASCLAGGGNPGPNHYHVHHSELHVDREKAIVFSVVS